MRPKFSHFRLVLIVRPLFNFLGVIVAVLIAGCQEQSTTPNRQSQQARIRRADRGEALLRAAATQLADLPAAIDTELRPPTIILDASKSANGADVLAVCTASPTAPDGPLNYVLVPGGNSRFRSIGVRSGDILKFFIVDDETIDEERRQAGFANRLAMEFTIAQVIDDNSLLIDKGIPASIAKKITSQAIDPQAANDPQSIPRGLLVPTKIEVWRNLDDRLIEINQKLGLFAERRLPPVGWQPSPDSHVLSQVVAWLNQWLRQSNLKSEWQSDPLLEQLDKALVADPQMAPFLSSDSLGAESFEPYDELQPADARTMRDALYDGRLIQEAIWLRDISRWAQGTNFNDLARATALFDWTIRNVQLSPDEDQLPHRPWQIVLNGRGTAEQRAWVFAMLCRQQGLDVVILATPDNPPFCLPALVLGDQLYLFDTRLGLPIPGPDGQGVATLEQVLADDSLLRQLDLPDAPYAMTSDKLQGVVPLVVADPFALTRRAAQVEEKLSGDERVVLSSRPTDLASRLKGRPGLADAQLWELPFRILRDQLSLRRAARRREALAFEPFALRPVLWKARTRHFQGRRSAGESTHDEQIDDHREAAQLYTSKSVRPTDREIAQTESAGRRRVDNAAKLNATLWVGLLSYDDGRYDVAAHWLSRPELSNPDSPWHAAARYNLARALEAQEKFDEAIKLLESGESPQQHGNRLRAQWLKAKLAETKTDE